MFNPWLMNRPMSDTVKALVVFSGGQDSSTCLGWALARYDRIETIGFNYGQRHRIELECRTKIIEEIRQNFPDWAAKLGPDHLLPLPALAAISETALTRTSEIEIQETGLPNTFVPGRNLLFLNYAAALGYRRGISTLVGGMCETDFSGYPDCRDQTIQTLAQAITLGMDKVITIETPLMQLDKAAIWALARELGGERFVELIVEHSHTCYLGDRSRRHDWGYGCGRCPACKLRRQGYENFANLIGLSA